MNREDYTQSATTMQPESDAQRATAAVPRRKNEDLLAVLIFRRISTPIVRWLGKTPVTPNQVTTASWVVAIIAGVLFLYGTWQFLIIGAVVLNVAYLLDHVDGQLSRLKGMGSEFGKWYDGMTDVVKIAILYATLAIGQYAVTGSAYVLMAGIVVMGHWFISYSVMFNKYRLSFYDKGSQLTVSKEKRINIGAESIIYASATIAACANIVSWYLYVFAVLGAGLWLVQFRSVIRQYRKAAQHEGGVQRDYRE